jgi:hypothetical protein
MELIYLHLQSLRNFNTMLQKIGVEGAAVDAPADEAETA